MEPKDVLTIEEVADLLTIPPDTVRKLVQDDRIPFFVIADHVRFLRSSLLRWASDLEQETARERRLAGRTLNLFKDTLTFFEEDQVTAPLIRALEHLEGERIEGRVRGVRALASIAHESALHRAPIRRVLASFIRRAAPASTVGSAAATSVAADVQEALTTLSRLNTLDADLIDLRETNLAGADLSGASLDEAILVNASLEGANLADASLTNTKLRGARLAGADLRAANLSGAHLTGAILSGANLSGANLSGAHLDGAAVDGANFSGANLADATGLPAAGGYVNSRPAFDPLRTATHEDNATRELAVSTPSVLEPPRDTEEFTSTRPDGEADPRG